MSSKNSVTENTEEMSEYSVTDILQAHDILISVLVGKMIGLSKNPQNMVNVIKEMVEMQDVSENVKSYVGMLLSPIEEALIDDVVQ